MKDGSRRRRTLESVRKADRAKALELLSLELESEKQLKNEIASIDEEVRRLKKNKGYPGTRSTAGCLESDSLARQASYERLKAMRNIRAKLETNLLESQASTDRARDAVARATRALDAIEKLP